MKRAKIIESVQFYKEGIAIAIAKEEEAVDVVLIAQTADTLLTMDGIIASFVIAPRGKR